MVGAGFLRGTGRSLGALCVFAGLGAGRRNGSSRSLRVVGFISAKRMSRLLMRCWCVEDNSPSVANSRCAANQLPMLTLKYVTPLSGRVLYSRT